MPLVTLQDSLFQSIAQGKTIDIAALPAKLGAAFTRDELLRKIVSDRLGLAGIHIGAGDEFLSAGNFRTSISRHYYAMYHSARAVSFGRHRGDDFQQHRVLPKNLPTDLPNATRWPSELNNARLIRNMADYDLYPTQTSDWKYDATTLAVVASEFVSVCEEYSINKGLI